MLFLHSRRTPLNLAIVAVYSAIHGSSGLPSRRHIKTTGNSVVPTCDDMPTCHLSPDTRTATRPKRTPLVVPRGVPRPDPAMPTHGRDNQRRDATPPLPDCVCVTGAVNRFIAAAEEQEDNTRQKSWRPRRPGRVRTTNQDHTICGWLFGLFGLNRTAYSGSLGLFMAESCIHTTMPDEEPQTRRLSELRERIEHLEARVTRLEESQEPTEGATNGLDHRDRAVIETIRIRGDPGPRLTVDLYLQETDISKRRTAKTRAKTLRERPDFPDLINE